MSKENRIKLDKVSDRHHKFKDLRIAIIAPRDDRSELLITAVQNTRAEVKHIWPPPELIPSDYDVVYCSMLDNLPARLEGLPGIPKFALILIIPSTGYLDYPMLEHCAPHGTIHLPVTEQAVISSLIVARSLYSYEQRLRKRIHQLDENLVSLRNIERAKIVLMKQMDVTEDKAYLFMRKQAMEQRVTIGSIASNIIDAQELFS
tara:strand:+ start:1461 stop:2072 length:612 start_codon:yes stop_codon:yes gene_type:complete